MFWSRSGGRSEPRRILVVRLYTIGDVVLCTPAIRELHRAYPDATIDFLTDEIGATVLAGNPHLRDILVWRRPWRDGLRLMRELRRRSYDTVVDLQSSPRTAPFVRATGAARRIGERGRGPRNLGYNLFVPKPDGPVYEGVRRLRLLEPLGIPMPDDLALDISIGEPERARARQVWDQLGLNGQQVVALSPVSRETHKQWGAERWARVADSIAETGARVLITHGPGERDQAAAVVERMGHPPAWDYGPTSIRELAAIYGRCMLWVGNDGGPKHLAVAMGLPTVTVFRWRLSESWTDLRPGSPHMVIEKPPPQGCEMFCATCPHLGCLDAVTTGEVIASVQAALGAVQTDGRPAATLQNSER